MYDYKDTVRDITIEQTNLPAEAVCIDGLWLDELVGEGYSFSTIYATGREALSQELDLGETKNNGAIYKGRRYPERTITVGIQILADDAVCFRNAWNRLAGLLNKDEVELVFNDEPDKYFKAHPGNIEPPEKGRLNGTAELEFICTDPFKYEADAVSVIPLIPGETKTFTVGGTVPVYPEFIANFEDVPGADCNSIEIFNQTIGKSLLFGDQNASFAMTPALRDTNYFKTLPAAFVENPSNTFDFLNTTYQNNGSSDIYTDDNIQFRGVKYYNVQLSADITQGKNWHAMARIKLKMDSVTSHNETVFYRITDSSGEDTLAFRFVFSSSTLMISVYRGESHAWTISKTIDIDHPYTGIQIKARKMGNIIKETVYLIKDGEAQKVLNPTTHIMNDAEAQRKIAKVHYHFYMNSENRGVYGFDEAQSIYVTDDETDTHIFIPGDELTCDCSSGEVLVNGTDGTEYGDIRNDFENFILSPGTNEIYLDCSNISIPPNVSVRFVKGWI